MKAFTRLLNDDPKSESIRKHEGFDYIPIGYLEPDLREVFSGAVKFGIISTRPKGQDTEVTARISVFHPVFLEWFDYDGVGTHFEDSIAYAEAKKTAAKQIGIRFGANLNRKEYGDYNPAAEDFSDIKLKEQGDVPKDVLNNVKKAKTLADLELICESVPDLQKNHKFL